MKVVDFMTYGKRHKNTIQKLLSNVLNNQRTLNATSNALVKEFGINSELKAVNSVEFSSERKYSITQFSNNKIYFMGAVTRVGCPLTSEQKAFIKEQQDKGLRIIAFSEMSGDKIDKKTRGTNSTLLAFIVLEEHIREDAIETIAWFKDNGVDIKIISGDDPATVSKIAQRVGVANSDKFISLETFSLKEVEQMADDFTVFGRVTPEQKYTIIKALKNKGKVVAMTGDGVNDTLALKEADCSIAMADGSEVARSISNLVLLESNFSSLPAVVKEGRQAVNNVQNSASLFLMKTFFAVVLVILTLFVQVTYIFTPKMMLLLEFFVIGVPSFFLTFEPNSKPIVGNFLPQVLKRSIPRAMLMLFNVIVVIVLYYSHAFNPESALLSSQEYITLVVLVLTYTGFLNLATLCIPPTLVKGFAVSISLAGITASVFTVPRLFNITMVSKNVLIIFFSIIAFSIILLTLLKLNKRRIDRLRDKVINLLQKEQ